MLNKKFALAILFGSQMILSGCAVIYDVQQDAAQRQCEKLTDWNERKTCLQQNKTTFEQYEKQRDDLRTKGTERK